MATNVGDVKVTVLPNAEQFHRLAKAELERKSKSLKVDVPLLADTDEFEQQMKEVEARLDRLESRTITIPVELDYVGEFERLESMIDRYDGESIDIFVNIHDEEIDELERRFQHLQTQDQIIRRYVEVDDSSVERMINGFEHMRQEIEDSPIVQRVRYEYDLPDFDVPERMPKFPGGDPVGHASKRWQTVLTLFPDMMATLNEQFDKGIQRIYDPYLNYAKRIAHFSLDPFRKFHEEIKGAETYIDALKVIQDKFNGIKKTLSSGGSTFLDETEKSLDWIKTEGGKSFEPLRKHVASIRALMGRLRPPPFKAWGRDFRDYLTTTKVGIAHMVDSWRDGMININHNVIASMQTVFTEFRNIGRNLDMTIGKNWRSWPFFKGLAELRLRVNGTALLTRAAMQNMFESMRQRNLLGSLGLSGKNMKAVTGMFKGLGARLSGAFSGMGEGLKDVFGGIGARFSGVFKGIQSSFGRFLAPLRLNFGSLGGLITSFAQKVSSVLPRAFSKAGGALKLFNGKLLTVFKFFGTKTVVGAAVVGVSSLITKAFVGIHKALPASKIFKQMNDWIIGRMMRYATGGLQIATGMFMKLGNTLMKSLLPSIVAVGAGLAALGGQGLIGGILALAGAIGMVVQGAILLAPALAAAAGVSFAALFIGLQGVVDGTKAAFSAETVEDFEKAIEKLPPRAQEVARAFREFKPAIDEMKTAVQDNMLEGIAPKISASMNNLLPVFSQGLQDVATAWNGAFKMAFDELSSDRARNGLSTIMDGVNEMSVAMQPVISNLLAGFGSLAEQAARYLGPIGEWIADITQGFEEWAEGLKAVEEGTNGLTKFESMIERAKTAGSQLGDIFGGAFGTIWNVFKAANEGGQGMLNGMADTMQGLKDATAEGTEGYKNIVSFTQDASAAIASLKPMFNPLIEIITTVGGGLARLGTAAAPGVTELLQGLSDGLKPIFSIADTFGRSIGNVLASLGPVLTVVGNALAPIIENLGKGLELMIVPFANIFASMAPMIQQAAEAFAPLLATVGQQLGNIFVAMMPLFEAFFQLLIDSAPILNQVFTFIGKIVVKVFEILGPLIADNAGLIGELFQNLMPLVDALGNGLLGTLDALAPVFVMISELMAELLVSVIIPLLPAVISLVELGFRILIDVINWLVPIIQALFPVFVTLLQWVGSYLLTAFTVFSDTIRIVWNIVSTVISAAVNYVIVPLLKVIAGVVSWVGDIFVAWFANFIKPTWDLFVNLITNVAGFFWDIVRGDFSGALDHMKNLFSGAVDWVRSVWNGLKRIFAKPITFFIQTVMNDGLIKGWNWVVDKVPFIGDEKKWDPIPMPAGLNFHSGGVLPGHSVGKDNLHFRDQYGRGLNLAGGEGIMRQEFVSAVGGEKGINRLNEEARHGRLKLHHTTNDKDLYSHHQGGVLDFGNFAQGGTLAMNGDVVISTDIQRAMIASMAKAFPNAHVTSGTRTIMTEGHPDNHNAGKAVDFVGPMQAMASWIARTYPNSAELFWDPGPNIKEGNPISAIGGHSDHVHWAMHSIVDPYTGEVVSQGSPGGGGGFVNTLWELTVKPHLDKLWEGITSRFAEPLKESGPYLGELPKAIGKGIWDDFISWVPSMIPGGSSGGGDIDISGVAGSNLQIGEELARRVGWVGAEWEALKTLWHNESNWNHLAQNPTSTAYGIPQFLDSTWATVGATKTSDPAKQIAAGIKYIQQRPDYGVPSRALALWQSRSPHWYDLGGEASGVGVMQKNVLQPERVLSPRQTKAFNDFVYGFLPQLISDFRKRPFSIEEGVSRITRELRAIPGRMAVDRKKNIDRMTDGIAANFKRFIAGDRGLNALDTNYDDKWLQRNGKKLEANLAKAIAQGANAASDPWGYLAAEEAAKERIEKEKEAKAEEAKKKADEAKKDKEDKEREKRKEKRDEELDKAKDDKAKEEIKKRHEAEDKQLKEKEDKEREIQQKKDKAEEDRISKLKETGEYYYGYKVFSNDGKDPNAREDTREEKFAKNLASSIGEALGLGSETDKVIERIGMLQSLGSAVQTATPAWIAAANGNPAGLNHNIAVATSIAIDDARKQAEELAPSLLVTGAQMAYAGHEGRSAPLVGNVYTGVTEAQLFSTLDRYGAVEARRRGGTIRTR